MRDRFSFSERNRVSGLYGEFLKFNSRVWIRDTECDTRPAVPRCVTGHVNTYKFTSRWYSLRSNRINVFLSLLLFFSFFMTILRVSRDAA